MPGKEVMQAAMLRICLLEGCNRIVRGTPNRKYCAPVCTQRAGELRKQDRARELRKAARGRARVCAVRLCQNLYEPWRFRADKRFCSNYCAARQKSSASKTKNAERLRLRRNAVTGRRCRFCWASDKNKRFHSARTCSACDRAKQRSPCHRCGGPFYSRPENRTGMIGCIVKNRIALGLDCKEESR